MIRIDLAVEGWTDFRLGRLEVDEPGKHDDFAWAERRVPTAAELAAGIDQIGVVHVRWPFHIALWGLARVGHEIEHLVEADFRGDKAHHPASHLCGRVGHFARVRGFRHLVTSKATVRHLRAVGHVFIGRSRGDAR